MTPPNIASGPTKGYPWEKAARGADGRLYPWGNDPPTRDHATFAQEAANGYAALRKVGSFEKGQSPYGVYDLAGSLWEWVADRYDEHYYAQSPEHNPRGPASGPLRVLRGGAWNSPAMMIVSANRNAHVPSARLSADWNTSSAFFCRLLQLGAVETLKRRLSFSGIDRKNKGAFPPCWGSGSFMELGANIVETIDGIGLLWYTREQFGDFILRVDWRATYADDNSGVFLRFPALNTDPANDWKLAVDQGYEIQIDDTGKNPDVNPPTFGDALHVTGSVYKLAPAVASRPLGQWNAYEIQAKGNDITVILNGQLVSSLKNGNRPKKGCIGLQNHHVGSRVQFKNIRIQTL